MIMKKNVLIVMFFLGIATSVFGMDNLVENFKCRYNLTSITMDSLTNALNIKSNEFNDIQLALGENPDSQMLLKQKQLIETDMIWLDSLKTIVSIENEGNRQTTEIQTEIELNKDKLVAPKPKSEPNQEFIKFNTQYLDKYNNLDAYKTYESGIKILGENKYTAFCFDKFKLQREDFFKELFDITEKSDPRDTPEVKKQEEKVKNKILNIVKTKSKLDFGEEIVKMQELVHAYKIPYDLSRE